MNIERLQPATLRDAFKTSFALRATFQSGFLDWANWGQCKVLGWTSKLVRGLVKWAIREELEQIGLPRADEEA